MSRTTNNGFPLVAISDFCDTGSGGTPSRSSTSVYFGGSIPWVKSGELRENVITRTEENITESGLKESAAKLLPPNTLLVALYGATVGRIGVLGIEAATNQAICHIIPDAQRADWRYLFHALKSRVPFWLSKRVGVGQPNISQGVIKDTKVPLPPIPEQRRIAGILDKADAIRGKRRQAEDQIGQLPMALFRDTFHEVLADKEMYQELTGISEIVSGVAKGRNLNGRSVREVPYLRVANVQAGYLDLNEIKTIPATEEEISQLALQTGDIVMTEGGDHDKLGRGALWDQDHSDCIHQNHVFRVRPNRSKVLPTFVVHFLQTDQAKSYFLRCAKKTTNLASINMRQLRALPVPVPNMKLQKHFDSELAKLAHMIDRQRQSSQEAENLFGSLVQRAFRGEL